MTQSLSRNPAPLRDVLYEMSLAKEIPDAELLDDFVRRYPEHAAALTAFAMEVVIDAVRPDEPAAADTTAGVSPAVSRAMSRFQNKLHEVKAAGSSNKGPESTPVVAADSPFAAMARNQYRALAARLNVNLLFLNRLRDGQIKRETIPVAFLNLLAAGLNVAIGVAEGYLGQGPRAQASAQFYKSEKKPEVGPQQSFEEAVQSSGLTEEQQSYLLSL